MALIRRPNLLRVIASATLIAFSSQASTNLPRLSIDDIVTMRRLLSVQISPDGRNVAYLVEEPAEEGRQDQWPTSLWVVAENGQQPRRLTFGSRVTSSPQWAPNGQQIAFIAPDAAGIAQIFLTDVGLGNPRQLTRHQSSITAYQWSPDSSNISFVASSTEYLALGLSRRFLSGFDAMELEPYQTVHLRVPNRLSVVSVSNGMERRVETGSIHIMSARWSPDGRTFLLTAADQPYADFEQLHARLMTVAAVGGKPVTYCATVGKLADADWLSDGGSIAFLGSVVRDTDFYPGGLFVCDGPGSIPRNLTENAPYSVESFRTNGGTIIAAIAENAQRFLGAINPRHPGYRRVTPTDRVLQFRTDYTVDRTGGKTACVLARWNTPPDVWLVGPDSPRQLTNVNPELERREYGIGREVKWNGKDGLGISGILLLPAGYSEGRRYPLITHMHGSNGNEANDYQVSSASWGQLLAANGFAVLMTNFRGSVTNGSRFMRGFWGDLGGADLDDAMAGSDAMVEAGIADPERLGISGVSYGGYLTACAITKTTKYRAAVMLSGVTNYYSVHTGWSAAPEAAAETEWGKNPYSAHDLLWDRSPSAHLDRVKTPTLILWGENDPAIPVMQAIELFRGLRYYGVNSKLVVYPREGHVPREANHLRDMDQRVVDWFRINLGG